MKTEETSSQLLVRRVFKEDERKWLASVRLEKVFPVSGLCGEAELN